MKVRKGRASISDKTANLLSGSFSGTDNALSIDDYFVFSGRVMGEYKKDKLSSSPFYMVRK